MSYEGVDAEVPADAGAREGQARANFTTALSLFRREPELTDWLTDRLLEVAATVPEEVDGFNLSDRGAIFGDKRLFDARTYPAEIWKKPGEKHPNRAAYGAWGSYVNAFAKKEYGRPLFIGASADLAESTNLAGFGKDFADMPGWGWYERDSNLGGTVLPTQITEFGNAGLTVGLATVNMADRPLQRFQRLLGHVLDLRLVLLPQVRADAPVLAAGPGLRAQGRQGAVGRRTRRTRDGRGLAHSLRHLRDGRHPALPRGPGHRPSPVGVQRGAGRARRRVRGRRADRRPARDPPAIDIPDREALGIPSHFEAARGAYVMRDFRTGPRGGTVFVQGTTSTANLVKVLPQLDERGLNVKIVACISPQLFAMQDEAYRESVSTLGDRWDGMAITNRAWQTMRHWIGGPVARDYSLTSDWDDRWRTGGTVDEVIDEAHLGPTSHRGRDPALRRRARITDRAAARNRRGRREALLNLGRAL